MHVTGADRLLYSKLSILIGHPGVTFTRRNRENLRPRVGHGSRCREDEPGMVRRRTQLTSLSDHLVSEVVEAFADRARGLHGRGHQLRVERRSSGTISQAARRVWHQLVCLGIEYVKLLLETD